MNSSDLEALLRDAPDHPDPRPPELSGEDVGYAVDDTALGRMLFAARPDGAVLAARFLVNDDDESRLLARLSATASPRVLRAPQRVDAVRRELDEFLAGRLREFTVRTDPALMTAFQRAVLTRLPAVAGYGQVITYGALAAAGGRPTASRAVGAALGANPLCVLLPCHRVVGASGSLTGYAGGVAAKRTLLELEGAVLA